MSLNPLEFCHARHPPVVITTHPKATCCEIFEQNWSNFFASPTAHRRRCLPYQVESGSTGSGIGVMVMNFTYCHELSTLLKFRKRYKTM